MKKLWLFEWLCKFCSIKQWREIHCDCFLSAEIKRCLSTTHWCKRLPMMHRCRDIFSGGHLLLCTSVPTLYISSASDKKKSLFVFFPICIKYIIYIVFSKQKSTFFSYVDCKWCSFKHWGGTSGFLLGSYFTHSSMVCFYSEFLFGVSTVQVRVCLWRANERRRVRTAASAPTAVFRSNDDAVMQAWPLCGTRQGVEPWLPTHAVQVLVSKSNIIFLNCKCSRAFDVMKSPNSFCSPV